MPWFGWWARGGSKGEIRAPGVIINGTVQGDVHSSKHLELAAKGRVQGNVFYALVEMAAGSEVNGSLTHMWWRQIPAKGEGAGP